MIYSQIDQEYDSHYSGGVGYSQNLKVIENSFSMFSTGFPVLPAVKDCDYASKDDYDMIIGKIDSANGGQDTFNDFVWTMVSPIRMVVLRVVSVTFKAIAITRVTQYSQEKRLRRTVEPGTKTT